MFDDDVRDVTWTFSSFDEMYGKELARREYYKSGKSGWGKSNDWSYSTSDQSWEITKDQMLTYSVEAQAEKTIYSPNAFSGLIRNLSKAERVKIFTSRLAAAKPAANQAEAIRLINKTMDGVEDEFSGIKKAEGIPERDDQRMYGILDDLFVKKQKDGSLVARTRGNRIVIQQDGSFEI